MTAPMAQAGLAPPPFATLLGNVAYIPPGFEGLYLKPFSYSVLINPTAVGANVGTTQIQNDSYFVVTSQYAEFWDAATGNTTQLLPQAFAGTVQILDTSSGGFLMDQPVPVASYFGTAQQPYVWLYRGMTYMPGGQLQVTLNQRVVAAQRATFTFTGFKVYDMPDLQIHTKTNG
jgi:hypothetical protein